MSPYCQCLSSTCYTPLPTDLTPPFFIFFCVTSSIPGELLSKRYLIQAFSTETIPNRGWQQINCTPKMTKKSNIFGTSEYHYTPISKTLIWNNCLEELIKNAAYTIHGTESAV